MNHAEFFTALKNGKIAPCYLFEGEEEYTKRSALQALRRQVAGGDFADMNHVRLYDPAPDALIAAAETLPFMSDRRFVEVRGCALLTAEKPKEYDEEHALEKYQDYVPAEEAAEAQGRKVFLSHNFRSGPEVISAVNDVFRCCIRFYCWLGRKLRVY